MRDVIANTVQCILEIHCTVIAVFGPYLNRIYVKTKN